MAQSKLAPHLGTWQLAEAKNKFSEVFTRAIEQGPQHVTRRGEEIVLLSREEYDQLTEKRPKKDFIQHLLSFPKGDIDLSRDPSTMREIEW
jgi:prevent-host-death family protein